MLWAESGGQFSDPTLKTELVPTQDHDIVNKKYVDENKGGYIIDTTQYPIAQFNDFNSYDWRTYVVPEGKMMGAIQGSLSITAQNAIMFRDLWTLFPEDEWEFTPGYITFFLHQAHDNFPWYVVWSIRVASMHRFDEFGQVFQFSWNYEGNPTLNSSKTYKATFECFRKK